MNSKELLDSLNQAQKEAVRVEDAHLIVEAGPGTGKTRVLTARVLSFLENGKSPGDILVITFTNKAAGEIRSRLSDLVGKEVPQIMTFHSWAYDFLNKRQPDFSVIGEDEQFFCFQMATKDINFQIPSKKLFKKIQLKKQTWPIDCSSEDDDFKRAWRLYHDFLHDYNFWDYDDLIINAIEALNKEGQKLYSYCLVDEFQDVSKAQYELLKALSKGAFVTIIGDPNQAIYGFRGASPYFMEEFERDFSPVKKVVLDTAYRCPQKILDAAFDVFQKNNVKLLSKTKNKGEIVYKVFENDEKEAKWIAKKIESLVGGVSFESLNQGMFRHDAEDLSDVCVLYRTNSLSFKIKKALERVGIPYQSSLKDDPEKDLILKLWHLFEAFNNNFTEYHLKRINIQQRDFKVLLELWNKTDSAFCKQLAEEICNVLRIKPTFNNLQLIKKAFDYKKNGGSFFLGFKNEQDFLDFDFQAVTLMTLHGAKGLEFPIVFIVGLDEELLPLKDAPIDEEKRLFFVGLTRASQRIYITSAKSRKIFGQKRSSQPSRFISLIRPHLIIEKVKPHIKKRSIKKRQKKLF